ncbi:enoyl-CoA hydratase/isomerase family protein [Actinomadura rugatobispora]|uniref:Enoyl-CoA hydratase/isomerase family protein n=1 Tax=Actinomadura rugatobispora TaxID=1994 RepID=A0ABW0ZZV7_9ACTN|nr:enoyl-CoA hydratase [Actinomadura rugatobispora]
MTEIPSFATLLLDVEGPIATVTLNRPGSGNTMDLTMRSELVACLDWIRRNRALKVVVLTGAGDHFCMGADARDFVGTDHEDLHDLMRYTSQHWFGTLWNLPQITIAAVNGVAAGGGANMVLACDLSVASERARFGETFVRLGLVPDLGGLFLLPRVVGFQRARRMCLTGEVLGADAAAELGIFGSVVPHGELAAEAAALAARLAERPARAVAVLKAILARSFESSMESTMLHELLGQSFMFSTREHRDALAAFFDRGRDPR